MPPTNGFQVCLNGGCEVLCRPGFRWCASGCCSSDFMKVGGFHSCELTPSGAINCWGRNHLDAGYGGALGDGTLLDRAQPFPVLRLTSGMVAVQLGAFHTCAMDQFGAVWCWGSAQNGRLGDGTTSDKQEPTPLMGLGAGAAIAITAGGSGGCALSRSGEARCWGENLHGEVGDGTTTPRLSPVLLSELGTSVIDLSFGGAHTCALMRGGVVRCWGANADGQLGDGTQVDRSQPGPVPGLSGVVRISAGERHTCAITGPGELYCWGDNSAQQLGLAASEPMHATPARVMGVTAPSDVSAGGAHTCALFASGQVQCWGANESGQLGDGTTDARALPAAVSGLTDATSISSGHAHTCARTRSGTRCWGNNAFGQLGDGSNTNRLTPVSPH
jgi:alpha-tubulin suppressor-like RCC1 family protein